MSDPGVEIAKEFASGVGRELARPGADLMANIIGVLGGDALKGYRKTQEHKREQRHKALGDEALKLLKDRGVTDPVEPNAAAVDELALAAQDEPREELQRLWARLLAAMFDPARSPGFRREFIEIAKKLEPIDVAALLVFDESPTNIPQDLDMFARKLGVNPEELMLAFRNLARLDLVTTRAPEDRVTPLILPLGRRFLAATSTPC